MEVGEFVMYRNDKGPFWVCTRLYIYFYLLQILIVKYYFNVNWKSYGWNIWKNNVFCGL